MNHIIKVIEVCVMKRILFVCVHNAGRSQMAEAFFNRLAEGKAVSTSAGTKPAEKVNSIVVTVMQEVGIDLSQNTPKALTFEILDSADRVITMGCNVEETCPASFVPAEDWNLEDPEGKPIEKVRVIREEIKRRVEKLIKELKL
jgi:arsenate reductase (thioredoxin)